MKTVKDIVQGRGCDTSEVNDLSRQIIEQMNLLIPNVLVELDDPNLKPVGSAVFLFFQPAAKNALQRAIKKRGSVLKIRSAYRTVAQQYLLYSWYKMGVCVRLAARPGLSNHEDGLAIDTPNFSDLAWRKALDDESWKWFGKNDEVHFSFNREGVRDDVGDVGVKAFQTLWNKHNPADLLKVDGRFGDETAKRMDRSPAKGFDAPRLLKLEVPPMQGKDVEQVQQKLVELGLLDSSKLNGFYDANTEAAVRQFQEKEGLSIDGKVGRQTRRALSISMQ